MNPRDITDEPEGPSVERAQLLIDYLSDELRGLRDTLPRIQNPDLAPQRHLAVALTALEDVSFRLGAATILVHEMQKPRVEVPG